MAQGQFHCPEHVKSMGFPAEGGAFRGAGQNARLAAKLTGFKIDIKPESDPGELPEEDEDVVVVDDEAEAETEAGE